MAPDKNPGTNLARVKPAALVPNKKTAALAKAGKAVGNAIIPTGQFQSLLDFATKGGRTAAWGLIGSSVALGGGLAFHVATLTYLATAGLMAGMGIYGTRVLSKIKDPNQAKMRDELRGLKAMWAAGDITEAEFQSDRAKVRKKYGY